MSIFLLRHIVIFLKLILPLFIVQYLICKRKIPFENFDPIISAFSYLDVNCIKHYKNKANGREIMNCIHEVVKYYLLNFIKKDRKPIGISVDTKTNRQNEILLAIPIKYLNDQYEVKEDFLYIGEIQNKGAQDIYNQIVKTLKEYDILSQLVFISTDGEPAISSEKNGVVGKLKKLIPWLQSTHCRTHYANLGLSDSLKIFDEIKNANQIVFKICQIQKDQMLQRYYRTIKKKRIFISKISFKYNQKINSSQKSCCNLLMYIGCLISHHSQEFQNNMMLSLVHQRRQILKKVNYCQNN